MDLHIRSKQLPGGDSSREFEGKDHGAGLTLILVNVETGHGPNLHRHPYEEIFVIHAGTGSFFVDESEVKAGGGGRGIAAGGAPPPVHHLGQRSSPADCDSSQRELRDRMARAVDPGPALLVLGTPLG